MSTIPYFDASYLRQTADSALSSDMLDAYERDGTLVLENAFSEDTCNALMAHMGTLVANFDTNSHRTVFQSTEDDKNLYDYFIESGSDIRFFFEDGALDSEGNLTCSADTALNKVGHALHDMDPEFRAFSRSDVFRKIADGLGFTDPKLLQSMYIFKQPRIGGEVVCHQDSSYIRSTPHTCVGLWVALEDATLENGCLWGIPGAHKGDGPKSIFRRTGNGLETETVILDDTPFEEDKKQPLEVKKGTVVVLHGQFPHLSGANTSDQSRHAYALHLYDGSAVYDSDNWLQRPSDLPITGF
ncbi:phytanoyl-CoA dioxygenase [Kordiimonas sediminis]|uniref:Phytanoyl-CoA dioxygenase n=1 Tax=Kordiimonas sediminis TaxID=1735581 RepID=A0A919AXI8_9PROT|nr:phytanoyl-CoA dioxygenase family protein [Kordiimonas sediminis]GHF29882.1 phytanoyl-CoA dioxygenase [Kordiimonas sediminis]